MTDRLSLEEKVLVAAMHLEEGGKTPFSAEQLVVAAWELFPDAFALDGYPEFPDSNRVYSKIMGSKGLRGRGWLEKMGPKLYRVTDAGRITASNLVMGGKPQEPSRATLDRRHQNVLKRLLNSRAAKKVADEIPSNLTFQDACGFWSITPGSTANTLAGRLTDVESILQLTYEIIKSEGTFSLIHGGSPITESLVLLLQDTHNMLLDGFRDELDIIRGRKDERASS